MARCREIGAGKWKFGFKFMKTNIYNKQNEIVGEIELSEKVFGYKWNPDLVYQVLMVLQANRRQPVAHTKTRGEVRGGGRKPWRQKGTGRARHGSTRSPIWIGGGVTFGPRNERNFTKKINKKMKRLALYSALSKKLNDNELKIIDGLEINQPKTRELRWLPKSTLLVSSLDNKNIYRAAANLPKVKALRADSLNVEDVAKYKNVLIEQKALNIIR